MTIRQMTRRMLLKLAAVGGALMGWRPVAVETQAAESESDSPNVETHRVGNWANAHDRIWLGEAFWANPMEDWRVVDGAAECQTGGGDRNIQLLTHQVVHADKSFAMSVDIQRVQAGPKDGGAGFRIGVKSDLNEYRSNCFAKSGISAGLVGSKLVLGRANRQLEAPANVDQFTLTLQADPVSGDAQGVKLTLVATTGDGEVLGKINTTVPGNAVLGNVALVNNLDPQLRKGQGGRYRFQNWQVGGKALRAAPEQAFGPILWSMYSLSDSRGQEGFVLKMSALTGPLGADDNRNVSLQVQKNDSWETVATEELDTDAWTAQFRVPQWNEKVATPYRLVYEEKHRDGSTTVAHRTGTIQANPTGRPLRLGTLTCQNDYAFPYEPVANNLLKLAPDMLYFSGDQLYENHGGYGLIREPAEPAILNYLRKFYQFGWAFGETMRDRPTVCIPDDHDVFQGNIWGEGGAPMRDLDRGASSKGGYREPARMVNVVHRTCAGHHPDAFDPAPCKQDISVYYGDMVYGDVSFAILGDRQWKSGPEHVETGSGRADHVLDPDFDCSKLDKPGLELLGERQEKFLEHWAEDWSGHKMKVLLSQTVFAGVATHHGRYDGYLKADLDCGSWPQTARNRAVEIIRKSKALHINGDQHLTTLSQYGVEKQRDSNWSFCTPAIAAGYPRWWRPDEVGMEHANRPQHGLANTGEFVDSFGNLVYVYAVGNPEVATERNRYDRAHQKGSGLGLVTIDTDKKTYHLEAFRFLVDATEKGKPENQFPGWPVTIHQQENGGDNLL